MQALSRSVSLVSLLLLSSCSLPFYLQAVGGQLELLRKRTPIEKILADEHADPELKAALQSISEIREFATTELGLPDNKSYTTYADLDRSYVVWNVVAAEEFSVDPVQWCFPFAGCVSYRGFFDRAKAEKFQMSLDERGLDTYSGGSSAYSTLGYFADPVLNTMIEAGSEYIAPQLFHELAHQRIYIKDDSELSEAFASAVEEYGTERWLRSRGETQALEDYRERVDRRQQFGALIARQQERLRTIYAAPTSDAEKRQAKTAAFEQMREEYASIRTEWQTGPNYDAWFAESLNNAALAAVATYRKWQPALRARIDHVGLRQFYVEVQELANLDIEARDLRLQEWNAESLAARSALQN